MATAPGYGDVSVEIRHSLLSRSAFITFGVDPVETNPSTVATKVGLAIAATDSLLVALDANTTIPTIRVSLGTDGSEDLVHVHSTVLAGSGSGETVPANCAVLVHKITTRGGRRGRGRLFLPWAIPETDVDEAGRLSGIRFTNLGVYMSTFLTKLADNAVPMVVLHGPGKTTMGAPNVVTSMYVDPLISTQRRRLGR